MRLAFAGTPEFAVPALEALCEAGHDIALVFSQPDRPAGRGRKLAPSPVAARAEALGQAVHKPERFDAGAQARLAAAQVDAMVVVAYGLILPAAALAIPRLGCLNIHASLLPRWRGAAPIQRAIEAGDAQTGVCIMQMEAGLDTGPVWRRASVPIGEGDTAGSLHDRLAALGAREVVAALADIAAGKTEPEPQSESGVTYARKLDKAEARIDWREEAGVVARRIRAFNPAPMAWTQQGETRRRLLHARGEGTGQRAAPGTVLHIGSAGVLVAAGVQAVRLTELQWPGGRPLPAHEAANGRLSVGEVLQ